MAKTKIVEENELIATRIPPGDNWDVDGVRVEGLVMALTAYMRKNTVSYTHLTLPTKA